MKSGNNLSRLSVLGFAFWLVLNPLLQTVSPAAAASIERRPHTENSADQFSPLSDEPEIPADWWQTVSGELEASEYQIHWGDKTYLPDIPAAYQSPNRRQDLRLYYTPAGVTVIPRRFDGSLPPWQWSVQLAGLGDGLALAPASLVADQNRVEYRRTDAGGGSAPLLESFTNAPEGVSHSFTIFNPPAPGSFLRLALNSSGGLAPVWPSAGEVPTDHPTGLEFRTPEGAIVLRYGGLQALDAAGAAIPAWLERTESGLAVVLEASAAAFPLQVSLGITSVSDGPDWEFEGNQEDAMFGFRVAAAGDVDCDNYSDVIVGAPYYDMGADENGRAFLFYGYKTGLENEYEWDASLYLGPAEIPLRRCRRHCRRCERGRLR